jgi:hypothetical protein
MGLERAILSFGDERLRCMEGSQIGCPPGIFDQACV